jgi:hypothetical protein
LMTRTGWSVARFWSHDFLQTRGKFCKQSSPSVKARSASGSTPRTSNFSRKLHQQTRRTQAPNIRIQAPHPNPLPGEAGRGNPLKIRDYFFRYKQPSPLPRFPVLGHRPPSARRSPAGSQVSFPQP